MMQLMEGTHYRVRPHQPLPTPKKSKEAVDCPLCNDLGESDEEVVEHVAHRKRSRPKGRNIRLDKLLHHMKKSILMLLVMEQRPINNGIYPASTWWCFMYGAR